MKRFLAIPFAALLALPAVASAAPASFFGPIVPEICSSCPCGFKGVMQIVQNVMNFGIALSIIIATIFIAWGGFLYILSSANPESRSTANKMLMNATIGILIVLSAWLIVDFTMKTLYGGQFGPWNTILTGGGEDCIVAKETKRLFEGGILATPGQGSSVGDGTGVTSAATASHTAAAAKLKAAGIGLSSSGNCSDRTKSTCTSLDTMRQDTVDQAIVLKQACGSGCSVTVTGGTEVGHADGGQSHESGYKIDLGLNAELNLYIQSLRLGGQRGSDQRYYDRCGNEYVRESSHWDITVNKGVCNPPR